MDVEISRDVHHCFKGTHSHSLNLIRSSTTKFSGEGEVIWLEVSGGSWRAERANNAAGSRGCFDLLLLVLKPKEGQGAGRKKLFPVVKWKYPRSLASPVFFAKPPSPRSGTDVTEDREGHRCWQVIRITRDRLRLSAWGSTGQAPWRDYLIQFLSLQENKIKNI